MSSEGQGEVGAESRVEELRRRLAELQPRLLAHSMDLLGCVLANVPDYIAAIAPDGTMAFVNRVHRGASLDTVLGKSVYDYIAPEQREAYRAGVARVVETGHPAHFEQEARLSDGTLAWFETRLEPIRDGGEVVAIIVVASDVTARRRAAKALRESETKLRLAVEGAGIGLWSWDTTTDAVVWEPAMCALFGFAPGTAPAGREGYLALVHPEDRARAAERIAAGVVSGAWEDEYRIVRTDGEVRWVLAKGRVLRDAHGDLVLGAVIDFTEKKLRDEQLRQAQKLEAIGELTAGIAHNFNNVLMGILPNLELALRAAPPPIAPLLREAEGATLRAADLVRQLMTFAGRNRPLERRIEDVPALVRRTVAMCRTTFDRRLTLEERYDARTPVRARVDQAQLEQAILNILINARDALAATTVDAPRIAIDVQIVPDGAAELHDVTRRPGDHVRVLVSDNGVGMDAATSARIFEPFFTTKPPGSGTGLGLATTHAIVREHGGWIRCESRPGEGTTFAIYLPAEEADVADAPRAAEPLAAGDGETILVVDDEPMIRQVVTLMLQSAGYAVRTAESGHAALELLADERMRARVHAILLDVSMPGLPREELRERLRAVAPDARVIYFTGYAFDTIEAGDLVLEKPVTEARLLGALRQVLDRAPA